MELTASKAQAKFCMWKEAAKPRLQKAAVIQGMFDGNPPFRRDKKRAAGTDWQANFNTLEGASRKDSAKTPYYELFSSNRTYATVQTVKDNPEGLSANDASEKMTVEFDRMMKDWKSMDANVWLMLDDFVGFNKGFFWWPTEDWRFCHIDWNKVYFPDGYSIDPETWEEFALEHSFTVSQLWDFVNKGEGKGWNKEAVMEAMKLAVPDWEEDDPMAIQKRLNDNVVEPHTMAKTVKCASMFWLEDGWWHRMVVPVQEDTTEKGYTGPESRLEREVNTPERKTLGANGWLYSRNRISESIREILAPFVFEVNSGSINALEGLGKRIVSFMQIKDRIANKVADNTLMRQNIVLNQVGSNTAAVGLVQVGDGVTVIPQGYEAATGQISGDVESGLAVSGAFDRQLDVNTGIYRPQFEKPAGNPESATAASIRFNQATVLTNSAVNRFISQLDVLFFEIFRRATKKNLAGSGPGVKSAKKFQKKLKDAGVSDAQIQDVIEECAVVATRSIGNGSPVMKQQAVNSLNPMVPFMGQRGLENYQQDYVAAFAGYEKVSRYFPEEDRNNIPTNDDWQATRENNDMQQGAPPLIAEGQDHEVHALRHLQAGIHAVQAVEQGADPTSAAIFLQLAIPHTAEHVSQIARPTVQQQMAQGLQQLEQGSRVVQQAVAEQQQQQQQAQQLSFEQQLQMQEVQSKMQERDMKTQQQLQHKQAKFEQDVTQKAVRFQQDTLTQGQ